MYRVTKLNKFFCLITYGRPDERNKIFSQSLNEENYKYELTHKEVSLSLLSNFINILRNSTPDFSVESSINNKEVLMNSIVEASLEKLKSQRDEIANNSKLEDKEKESLIECINKKIFKMKIMKFINMKKLEKDKEQINKQENENEEMSIENNINNNEANSEEMNQHENLEMDTNSSSKARRTHCHLYIFRKLENSKQIY